MIILGRFQINNGSNPTWDGETSLTKEAWLEPLTTGIAALEQAIKVVVDETREADQTQVAKQRAMAQYDSTFSITANLLSHLLKTAGEGELARKVRPSTRRPGQTIGETEDETVPAPTPESPTA